ncbi:MAG: AraC family transcriptional regulator [Bradyrhizobium sp.]|nr:AraC family transcriptional regulator [Bradyrhizobium sp.]
MMDKVFTTADLHPRDRFDYWHSVACKNVAGHSSKPACRQTFNAELESGDLGDIRLVMFKNSPMEVVRSVQHLAHADGDELFFCRQVSGTLAIEQAGRQLILTAGDGALIDPLLPYKGKFLDESKLLVLKLPRRPFEARAGHLRELIAIPIKYPPTNWTSAFVAMLPELAKSMTPLEEKIARDQTLDLIALSLLGARAPSSRGVSSARSIALLSVRAAIESRLSDPTLDCENVAAAAGISVRYANSLLAQQDSSITRHIRTRRLARCQMAFVDPRQSHRSISDIAQGWGFTDMTHFGRCFKDEYGLSPRDYRKLQKA